MPPEPSVTSACEGATVLHLEVLIGAVAEKLRAARPKVGEPGDVLLGRRGGCLVQADRGHACPLSLPGTSGILSLVLITHLGPFCTCAVCLLGATSAELLRVKR